jgi:hypothetical protein
MVISDNIFEILIPHFHSKKLKKIHERFKEDFCRLVFIFSFTSGRRVDRLGYMWKIYERYVKDMWTICERRRLKSIDGRVEAGVTFHNKTNIAVFELKETVKDFGWEYGGVEVIAAIDVASVMWRHMVL